MAGITCSHYDQHYSNYILRNSMSHSLQRAEKNGDDIKFYWIKLITSLLLLCKEFYNPELKVIITISFFYILSLHTMASVFHLIMLLLLWISKTLPQMNFWQFKLLTISRMKCTSNHLYLKMALLFSDHINLNSGTITRHPWNNPKFEVFNNKGLHLIHLNINSLLLKIDKLRNIAKCSNAAVI